MGQLYDFCHWLTQTYIGKEMRVSDYLFPSVESLHLMGTVVLVASTSILSLRLAGVFMTDLPVSKIAKQFLPWAWGGFGVQVLTGVLLFMSEATLAYNNPIFLVKMALLIIAGVNALYFQKSLNRDVNSWDSGKLPSLGARLSGYASILIWFSVVAAGRLLNGSVAQSVMPQ
jgi:hypothetical protein